MILTPFFSFEKYLEFFVFFENFWGPEFSSEFFDFSNSSPQGWSFWEIFGPRNGNCSIKTTDPADHLSKVRRDLGDLNHVFRKFSFSKNILKNYFFFLWNFSRSQIPSEFFGVSRFFLRVVIPEIFWHCASSLESALARCFEIQMTLTIFRIYLEKTFKFLNFFENFRGPEFFVDASIFRIFASWEWLSRGIFGPQNGSHITKSTDSADHLSKVRCQNFVQV